MIAQTSCERQTPSAFSVAGGNLTSCIPIGRKSSPTGRDHRSLVSFLVSVCYRIEIHSYTMGSQLSKVEDSVYDVYKKSWPQAWFVPNALLCHRLRSRYFRYLAPSFLASIGALGFVGYSLSQPNPVPTSSNVSFLHLVGVAGGFGVSVWITAVQGKTRFSRRWTQPLPLA